MEDDVIRNILSPAADQEVESSWSESKSVGSGVTAEGSRWRSCKSCGNVDMRLEECTVWTNEKHKLYLDFLETSFVRQYRMLGGKTHKSLRCHDPPASSYESTDQKINFGKKRTHLEASSNSYPRESPFTIGFTHAKTIGAAVQGTFSPRDEIDCSNKASPRTSMRNPVGRLEYLLCHERSKGSSSESSGQNFTDKEREENSSSSPVPKRHKRDTQIDSSISNQVVPL